jgi:hypothetical protein
MNEGAALVNDLVTSKNTYDFSIGPTVMTDKGPVKIDYVIANLPPFGDICHRKCGSTYIPSPAWHPPRPNHLCRQAIDGERSREGGRRWTDHHTRRHVDERLEAAPVKRHILHDIRFLDAASRIAGLPFRGYALMLIRALSITVTQRICIASP